MPAKNRKSSLAWQALEQINMIYHVDNTLKELTPEERKKRRQDSVKPLVEAYFAWVKEKKKDGRIAEKSKTGKGLSYSLNQEEYLKVFLENGNVPLDNNVAERQLKNKTAVWRSKILSRYALSTTYSHVKEKSHYEKYQSRFKKPESV